MVSFAAKQLLVDALHLDAELFKTSGFVMQGKEADQAGDDVGGGHDGADNEVHVGESHALEDVQEEEGLWLGQEHPDDGEGVGGCDHHHVVNDQLDHLGLF